MNEKIQLQWEGRHRYYSESVLPVVLKPISEKSCGPLSENMVIEGDNLSVMSALLAGSFKLRGSVDMLLWDPPYNTGNKDFRYVDDYNLSRKEVRELQRLKGKIKAKAEDGWVSLTDPSRHTKWLNFMAIRLWYGQKLLKKTGLIAVTIDDREMFRLGVLMDEIFGEENRVACAPWLADPSGGTKNATMRNGHEYVLIYHNGDSSAISKEERSVGPLNLKDSRGKYRKGSMLLKWGEKSLRKDRPTMWLPLKAPDGTDAYPIRQDAQEGRWRWGSPGKLDAVLADPTIVHWEKVAFDDGATYQGQVERWVPYEKIRDKKRAVGWSSWLDKHGHNSDGTKTIKDIFGKKVFDTPKPVELYEWLVSLHTNEDAIILDAFAGTGTTAHAVLKVNQRDETNKRFILIESGQGDDAFCDSVTAERVRRVISGDWAVGHRDPIPGSFTYYKAGDPVGRSEILSAKREELADIILQAAEDSSTRVDSRINDPKLVHLIGKTRKGNAIALVWGEAGTELTTDILLTIRQEAESHGLKAPYYIYATHNGGPNGIPWYIFCQIPDSILAALGITEEEV